MRRTKIVLCAAIAAVLLVGIIIPAAADKQTDTYSCTKTTRYPCTKTVSTWCSESRRVYRCHTANVCSTKTEEVCTWNPYLYVYECENVEKRVCQPVRRCKWETETSRVRCTKRVDSTCITEVPWTCTKIDPHTHSIYCTMPAGASDGGYTSGTITGSSSDYTNTHHDPQHQCSEKKAKANRWLRDNPEYRCAGEAGYITDTRTAAACVTAGGTHWAGASGDGRVAYWCYKGSERGASSYEIRRTCSPDNRKGFANCSDSRRSVASSLAECAWIESQEPLCICPLCAEAGITGKHNVRMAAAACPELLRCEFDGSTPLSGGLKEALDGIDEAFAGYEDASLGVMSPRSCDSAKTVEQRRQDLVIFRAAIPTCGEQVEKTATCYGSAAPRSDLAAFRSWMMQQFGTTNPSVWCCSR